MDDARGTTNDDKPTLPLPADDETLHLDATLDELPRAPSKRYRERAVLGRGGMGEVRLCHDELIGRDVALKVITGDRSIDSQAVSRFLKEARLQGQLEHPAIVPVHDVGEDERGAPYFTMKRVRGRTLADVVRALADRDPETERRFTLRKLLSAFVTVCLAVDFAHRRGVLHRDLKPGNVMMGAFGEVYVLDWGIAKLQGGIGELADEPTVDANAVEALRNPSAATRAGQVLGTPGYMSPEQMLGDAMGPESDVYSLGAILYEILALDCLHAGAGFSEIVASTMKQHQECPSARRPERDLSPELDAICMKAVARDPADRYPSARALSEAVEAYLDGDRDLAHRREIAAGHERAAAAALGAPITSPDAEVSARREALRESFASLTLDPKNERARASLVDALTRPFQHVPRAAAAAIEREDKERSQELVGMGFWAYLSLFGYLPVLAWMGIRDHALVAVLFTVILANAVAQRWCATRLRLTTSHLFAALVLNTLTIGYMSLIAGPFLLVPATAAVNVVPYMLFLRRRFLLATAIASLSIVVPFALQLAGVFPVAYDHSGGDLRVVSSVVALPRVPTSLFLFVASVGTIGIAAYIVAQTRKRLLRVETRLHVNAWLLTQLLPERGRAEGGAPRSPPAER